jgi:hypothetical protein
MKENLKNTVIFIIIFSLFLNTGCASLLVDKNLPDDGKTLKEEKINTASLCGGMAGLLAGAIAVFFVPQSGKNANTGFILGGLFIGLPAIGYAAGAVIGNSMTVTAGELAEYRENKAFVEKELEKKQAAAVHGNDEKKDDEGTRFAVMWGLMGAAVVGIMVWIYFSLVNSAKKVPAMQASPAQ